jgi:hypothetical protein
VPHDQYPISNRQTGTPVLLDDENRYAESLADLRDRIQRIPPERPVEIISLIHLNADSVPRLSCESSVAWQWQGASPWSWIAFFCCASGA